MEPGAEIGCKSDAPRGLLIGLTAQDTALISDRLRGVGLTIDAEETARVALARAAGGAFRLIVIDIDHVDTYGPQLIATLRGLNDACAKARITALGTMMPQGLVDQLRRAGADDTLPKSLSAAQEIERLLTASRDDCPATGDA